MSENVLGVAALIVLALLLLGIVMMFITKIYLNRSRRRQRYIELIWGTENDWYKGKNFDFVTANFVVSTSPGWALLMNRGWVHKNAWKRGIVLLPNLHRSENYKKLLNEFPFFVRWEISKSVVLILGTLGLVVIFGLSKGW